AKEKTRIDKDRERALVESARALVEEIAGHLAARFSDVMTKDELFAAANIALAERARTFDPSQGAAFTTYAYWGIRGAMLDALRTELHARRIGGVTEMHGEAFAGACDEATEGDLPPSSRTAARTPEALVDRRRARQHAFEVLAAARSEMPADEQELLREHIDE